MIIDVDRVAPVIGAMSESNSVWSLYASLPAQAEPQGMAKQIRNIRGKCIWPGESADATTTGGPTLIATPQWRPIETAPKDGTEILVAAESILLADHQLVDMSSWWQTGKRWSGFPPALWRVTHWMPKPDPPPRESSESHRQK